MKHTSFFLFLMLAASLPAQQSSKSKSKDRFRERSGGGSVLVKNAGELNQDNADFAPTFYRDGLVFMSERNGSPGELYYAFFDAVGTPVFPQKISFGPEKRSGTASGTVSFSHDNQTAFFSLPFEDKNGKKQYKIAVSKREKNGWSQAETLPFNSDAYSCLHPSLSTDGRKLYFSSDMPGGVGGYDIYVVERQGAGWGTPVNLGPLVNTQKQETFPYISADGTLFFSSNGQSGGLGGFDNYCTSVAPGDPGEIINLKEPYNSSADDLSFILADDGKTGFFISKRPGGKGNTDIYRFEMPRSREAGRSLRISTGDAATGQAMRGVEIHLFAIGADGIIQGKPEAYVPRLQVLEGQTGVFRLDAVRKDASGLGRPDYYSNAAGEARVDLNAGQRYLVVLHAPGYQPVEKILEPGTDPSNSLAFQLSPLPAGETAPEPAPLEAAPGSLLLLDALFADPGDALLSPNAQLALRALHDLLNEHPDMRIAISGHTQNRIDNALADRRAKTVKEYLVWLGANADRIDIAGTGAAEPRSRSREGVVVWIKG